MSLFQVSIDMKKIYRLNIEAETQQEAWDKAEAMQSTQIAEEGSLVDVTTEAIEVTPLEPSYEPF